MNDKPKDGTPVERIYWHPNVNGKQESLCETPVQKLIYVENYHGDHDECWVVVIRDGQEIARHNTRFLETIVWKSTT